MKENIAADGSSSCVASGLLTDTQEGLTKCVYSSANSWFLILTTSPPDDVRTILGGLMSGGFETMLATAIAGIAYLASPEGQSVQEKAYSEMIDTSGDVEAAFQQAVEAENSPYVEALVRETLRHYPPLHILPPRQTYQEFEWNNATVPKGVMVLVNAQAVNHGMSHYPRDGRVPMYILEANRYRPRHLWTGRACLSAREMD